MDFAVPTFTLMQDGPAGPHNSPLSSAPYWGMPTFPPSNLLPRKLLAFSAAWAALMFLWYMTPGRGGGGGRDSRDMVGGHFNYRIPLRWSPEGETTYSSRADLTDISLWVLLTDLTPQQQAAAVIMRLGSSAREAARMMSVQDIMHGGHHLWSTVRSCLVHYGGAAAALRPI